MGGGYPNKREEVTQTCRRRLPTPMGGGYPHPWEEVTQTCSRRLPTPVGGGYPHPWEVVTHNCGRRLPTMIQFYHIFKKKKQNKTRKHSSRMCTTCFPSSRHRDLPNPPSPGCKPHTLDADPSPPGCSPLPPWMQTPLPLLMQTPSPDANLPPLDADSPPSECRPPTPGHVTSDAYWEANPPSPPLWTE